MCPGGGDPPGGGDKPPGLEVFKTFEALRERYNDLKEKGGFYFEFVLAKYKDGN